MGRKIVVEARKDPQCASALDAIASVCRSLGHEVVRWRGPLSGRMPFGRWLPVCDLAVLWNGAHRSYRPALARLRAWGASTLFVELGWHPQQGRFQIDHRGVNGAVSWSQEPLTSTGKTTLPLRSQGDLLVLLQLDDDTQITERSPYFANMEAFAKFMCRNSAMPVRLRAHPKAKLSEQGRRELASSGCLWDTASSLAKSLEGCRAVACINSSSAVEAMAAGLPVMCYGESIYRHPGAVYCLSDNPLATRQVSEQLASGICELISERCAEVVDRVHAKQWTIEDFPDQLPGMLEGLLTRTPVVKPMLTSSDRLEQAICWTVDAPARILYAHRMRGTCI